MIVETGRKNKDRLLAGDVRLLTITRAGDAKRPFVVRFRVAEREFELAVTASELQSYRAFQRAALERASVMIRHPDERASRRWARWPSDVDLAIARGAREA